MQNDVVQESKTRAKSTHLNVTYNEPKIPELDISNRQENEVVKLLRMKISLPYRNQMTSVLMPPKNP